MKLVISSVWFVTKSDMSVEMRKNVTSDVKLGIDHDIWGSVWSSLSGDVHHYTLQHLYDLK